MAWPPIMLPPSGEGRRTRLGGEGLLRELDVRVRVSWFADGFDNRRPSTSPGSLLDLCPSVDSIRAHSEGSSCPEPSTAFPTRGQRPWVSSCRSVEGSK